MTDQFLSIDPEVAATGQPYVFTNDNPLNGSDPSGLMLSTGPYMSNAKVQDVGAVDTILEGQGAVNQAIADFVKIEGQASSANRRIHKLWIDEVAANLRGSADALGLTRLYNNAVASLKALASPEAAQLAQYAYDAYSLYNAGMAVARTGALGARLLSMVSSTDETLAGDITTLDLTASIGVEVGQDITLAFAATDGAGDAIAIGIALFD